MITSGVEELNSVNVLLVEDSVVQGKYIEECLSQMENLPSLVTRVLDCGSAIDCLKTMTFNIVLLDLNLPDSFGGATYTKISDYTQDIPVVILSQISNEKLATELIEQGAQDYLIKNMLNHYSLRRIIRYSIQRKKHDVIIYEKNKELEKLYHELASELSDNIELTTQLKNAESVLKNSNVLLEKRVKERTKDLADINKNLTEEVVIRKKIENELLENQNQLNTNYLTLENLLKQQRAFFDSTFFGIAVIRDFQFVLINRQLAKMFAYKQIDLLFESFNKLMIDSNSETALKAEIKIAFSSNKLFFKEIQLKAKNGKVFWCNIQCKIIDINDLSRGSIWIIKDISEQKSMADNVRLYELMSNTSKDNMTMTDENYRYVALNDAFLKAQNKSREELVGITMGELWGQEVFETFIKPKLDKCLAGEIIRYENEFEFGKIGKKTMDVSFYPFLGDSEKKYAVAVSHDITAIKEGEKALIVAKEKAEETNRLKSDFFNIISHELRTPLTVILANSPFLTDRNNLPDAVEIEEISIDIEESAQHLLVLVNDLLDFSKLDAGKMDLQVASLSTNSIVEDVCSKTAILLKNKSLYMDQEVDELMIMADPVRIKQILLNLLSNAVKFTDEGGIMILVTQESGFAVFSVIDSGCGIEKENLPKVFDVFRQLDDSLTRSSGGTGLGLSITKKLVELHKGELKVKSEYGKGSTFSFTIPLVQN